MKIAAWLPQASATACEGLRALGLLPRRLHMPGVGVLVWLVGTKAYNTNFNAPMSLCKLAQDKLQLIPHRCLSTFKTACHLQRSCRTNQSFRNKLCNTLRGSFRELPHPEPSFRGATLWHLGRTCFTRYLIAALVRLGGFTCFKDRTIERLVRFQPFSGQALFFLQPVGPANIRLDFLLWLVPNLAAEHLAQMGGFHSTAPQALASSAS